MPAQRFGFDAKVIEAALERLELAVGLAIEVEPDLVEVPQAAVKRQVAAPIVGIARQRDAGAGFDRSDAVGAGTDRRRHRGFLEGCDIDGMLGQYRHQAEDQRQFAVAGAAEVEPHRARVGRIGLYDLGVILAKVRTALVAQQRPGKQHVLRKYRLPVREPRSGIETEGDIAAAVVGFDAFCQQTVEREGLVIAPRHQALDHEAAYLLHGETPDDQGIEAVESPENALHQSSAFRRIRIGIGHVAEIGRQRRRSVHRDGVALCRRGLTVVHRQPCADREDAADQSSNA